MNIRAPDMQPHESAPAVQRPTPMRRVIAWLATALVILAGIALFFRYAPTLTPLLG